VPGASQGSACKDTVRLTTPTRGEVGFPGHGQRRSRIWFDCVKLIYKYSQAGDDFGGYGRLPDDRKEINVDAAMDNIMAQAKGCTPTKRTRAFRNANFYDPNAQDIHVHADQKQGTIVDIP